MSVPAETTVLVIGGGPGGSYTAATLAREGIDTVLLEAEIFPRYHVGESMVPSIRHFLRFIDLETTFLNHGFVVKKGAAFKFNSQPDAYTDFIVESGPDGAAWNVIRSESDDLMFRHAGKCGAQIFDGVKVQSIEFAPLEGKDAYLQDTNCPGKPVSATWSKKDGSKGSIKFDYVVDASGRQGIVSTKHLKSRIYNEDLNNVASWAYWKDATSYAVGTYKEGQPFFAALNDGSGWAWFIPLHNGTTSVGVVMDKQVSTDKKRAADHSSRDFYVQSVKNSPAIAALLSEAELATDVKHAADWSYDATTYSSPYVRIVGDAGCFIDPFFSSGVHLALSGALSAALTICASIRGDCDEKRALEWHTNGVTERYTRFKLVVMGATKQIRLQNTPVLNKANEEGFDRAFSIIKPVIQGIADVGKGNQDDYNKAVDFTSSTLRNNGSTSINAKNDLTLGSGTVAKEKFDSLKLLRDPYADLFSTEIHHDLVANLETGSLGLKKTHQATPGGQIDLKAGLDLTEKPGVEMEAREETVVA